MHKQVRDCRARDHDYVEGAAFCWACWRYRIERCEAFSGGGERLKLDKGKWVKG
jgi:hypothetical protein